MKPMYLNFVEETEETHEEASIIIVGRSVVDGYRYTNPLRMWKQKER
jgi:hypothetical protein